MRRNGEELPPEMYKRQVASPEKVGECSAVMYPERVCPRQRETQDPAVSAEKPRGETQRERV